MFRQSDYIENNLSEMHICRELSCALYLWCTCTLQLIAGPIIDNLLACVRVVMSLFCPKGDRSTDEPRPKASFPSIPSLFELFCLLGQQLSEKDEKNAHLGGQNAPFRFCGSV